MDFRFTQEEEAFRAEVRAWLPGALASEPRLYPEDGWVNGFSRSFSRALGQQGWIGLTWPRQYGGQERTPLHRLILTQELLLAGAPVAAHWLADRQVGPALLAHGSEAQKERYLPGIVRGETVFCIGMSEPGSGSDLAATSTIARETERGWVIHGEKVWTTFAHEADFCYLVARSDRAAPKHKGLSEFVVDMRTPGVTVHPIPDLLGERHFNQVIFDGVRVPADALIGGKHRGWYQIASQLDFERGGIERIYSNVNLFRDALAAARESGAAADGRMRDRLAQLYIAVRIGELLAQRVAWLMTCGQVPNWEAALSKCFSTETEQQVAEAVAALLGPRVLVGERDGTSLAERAAHAVLYAPAYTIQGGTSNVLRNIIATRALGLPHD